MKKILTFLFVLALVPIMQAQWVVIPFDNAVGTLFSDPGVQGSNFYTNGPTAQFNLTNDPDHIEGTGSMKLDYRVEAYDGWGGYVVRTSYVPGAVDTIPYLDLSAGTDLKLNYKVTSPVNMSATGTAFIEFKMAEYNDEGQRDLWLHHTAIDLSDASGGWLEINIPLRQDANNTLGFVAQFADGDGVLQLERIKGYELAVVYLTSGGPVNTPFMTGSVLWDNMTLVGNRYTPLTTFDNSSAGWGLDWMEWAGTDKGAIAVSDEGTDKVEGAGSLKVDYTLSAPFGWGGFVAIDSAVTVDSSIAERTALVLYVKNLAPVTADAGRAFIRFFVMENSSGPVEEWIIDANVDLSQAFDWTHCYLPLTIRPMGVNDRFPPKDGFALKNGVGDLELNPEFITKIRIEIFGRGTEDGFGTTLRADGTLLFDILQTSGFQFADDVAPNAPANIFVVPGSFTNLVTWEDVVLESGEKYNVYASTEPITDLTSDKVDLIAGNVLENIQVVDHLLLSPNTNQSVTYYYAITCKDYAGNVGLPGFSASTTNNAKGVAVISEVVPTFVADGNLAEWQSLPKFRMYSSDGTGTIGPNFTITDDADCSADAWVAIDANYLYVAFKVNDDVLTPTGTFQSYELDSPDLFIGLYDWKKAMHTTYQRGSQPDYQIRFNEGVARNDDYTNEYDSLLVEGPNYFYGELFPTGYVVEAKISLNDMAFLRKRPDAITDTISVGYGDRIPIDFGINDNDGTGREGLLFYSPRNNDQGHANPSLWSHTWITDWYANDVENENGLVNTFSLSQNYPNPFNPATIIRYSIAEAGLVTLKIYDVLGREVLELVNEEKAAGSYDINFNASKLSSGVYMYKIESGSYQEAKKMILVK